MKALHEATPERRPARETVPAWKEGKMPQVGDEMVVLKGREKEIGFQRIKVESHKAEGGEAVDGAEELVQGL